MKTPLKGWLVLLLLLGTTAYCVAEQITLTTYYPSPRGVYHELRTLGNIQVGSINPPALGSPAPRLHVVGDGNAPAFQVDASAAAPNALVVDRSGNVGIGTAQPNPNVKLDVDGAINASLSGGLCIAGDCRTAWPGFSQFQVFDASGTFTVPPGVTTVMVEVWGGGGGGGYPEMPGYICPSYPAGGGGGGGYGKGIFNVTPENIFNVIVGAGGAGGQANVGGNGHYWGDDGGASSFGIIISATGGKAGTAYVTGTGGTSSAPINITGGTGWSDRLGGVSPNGGPGRGIAPGSGGNGETCVDISGSIKAQDGAHGRVIVWW